jgi:hypothetical protein
MQIEMHTAEPLVPEPVALEVEIAVTKLKIYITRYHQILVELI